MKKYFSYLSLGLLSLAAIAVLVAGPVRAADYLAPEEGDEDGRVSTMRDAVYNNLYVVGGDISINNQTTGDLYVAGGWVSVEGAVEQDIVAAGGTVVISEPVNGDVRVLGGKVTLNAPVKGDVLLAAGVLTVTEKANIGGELRVAGGEVDLNGPVAGGLYFLGETLLVNSKVDGQVKITATEKLIFGSKADITEQVSYQGKKQAVVSDGAKANVSFTQLKTQNKEREAKGGLFGFLLGGFVIKFFAWLIAGLIALRLFKPQLQQLTNSMVSKPWANLAIGFAVAVVAPIALIIVLLLVVGYYIALVGVMIYGLLALLSGLLAAIFVGSWLVKVLTKKEGLPLEWQTIVIGITVMLLIKFIPVVGWVICFALYLMAFGAMSSALYGFIKNSGKQSTNLPESSNSSNIQ